MTTRLRRRILYILETLLLALVVVVVALIAVLDTERGSRWLLARALPLAAPEAGFASVTGTLARGVTIEALALPLDAADIRIARIEGRWNLWNLLGGQLPIERLAVREATITLLETDTEPTPPGPWPSLSVPLPVTLDDVEITDLRIITADGGSHHIDRIAVAGSGGVLHTRIRHLEVAMGDYHLRLAGRIANRVPYDADLRLDWSAVVADEQAFAGQASLTGSLAGLKLDHRLTQPSPVTTSALLTPVFDPEVAAIDPLTLAVTLATEWNGFELPVPTAPRLTSDGSLALTGTWADYHLRLQSRLAASTLQPPADAEPGTSDDPLATLMREPGLIELEATGRQFAIELVRLYAETLAGTLEASGTLTATPLAWDLQLAASDVDAGLFVAEWPAVISARLHSDGHWQEEQYRASLTIEQLTGRLFDTAIAASGDVLLEPRQLQFDRLEFALGDNRLAVHGALGDTLALDWQLSASQLAQIHRDLSGTITSSGTVNGSLEQPRAQARLDAGNLGFGDIAIASLDLDIDTTGLDAIHLDLGATGINAGPLNAGVLRLEGSGGPGRHHLALSVDDGDNRLALEIRGGLGDSQAGQRWQGSITGLDIDNPLLGPWRLADSAPLALSAAAADLGTLCLAQDGAAICAKARYGEDKLTLSGNIDTLPLAPFTQALPEEASIEGVVDSRFAIAGPLDALSGELSLDISAIQLRYQPVDADAPIEFDANFSSSARLDRGAATATLDFTVPEVGDLRARVQTPALAADATLEGAVTAQFATLAWLDGLLPQLDNLDGNVAVDLVVGGQAAAPQISGTVALNELQAQVPLAGITLSQGALRLGVDSGGRWQLNGQLNSGEGDLRLAGNGLLSADNGASGQISIDGTDFTLVDRPDARALLSPALTVEFAPDAIRLRGDLLVPQGELTINALPEQAVDVSADERVFPAEETLAAPSRPIDVRIQLTIDDRFHLQGYGLSTRLGGTLRISQRGDDPPRANGTLSLVDGVYQAYGQKLEVERGHLLFQGPVDNPGLNIRAVRETPTATVGIDIGGVAQDIRSELFSTPPLSPTDTIAILITGKAPSQMNQSDANQVINAAAALGISQSEGITNNLERAFGLDVVDLQGGDDYLDSALVVGKYLTPELFISYAQNLFSPAGSVQLDYSLTRYLGLKASSGETQSVDLLYRIEH